ncbi:MAG: phosphoglycerate dehydrogenase [Planctomycetes bacterium]|nr:phosphoglycerate dehydrogenase [Planctomycetota bacterium]
MAQATASTPDVIHILIADKLSPAGVEMLKNTENVTVDVKPGLKEDELAAIAGNYDGMIIRSGAQVTAKVLANPGKLRVIARAGVGVDNVDLDAATEKGVLVMNSADASTITTAEHAFALLMALARNIGPAYKVMTEGGWDRNKFVGRQLEGKTLGVVGFGRIGRTVAERGLAFGMKVVAVDTFLNAETALDGQVKIIKSFDEMLGMVDFVSFHVPLNDHTRNMLNAERFAKARKGFMIINAARGGVIELDALIAALDAGQCGGAALDVYEVEPLEKDSPLRKHPKILLTPHLGASTEEAQEAVSNHACAQALEYLQGKGIRGAVNAAGLRMDLEPMQIKYVELAKRMARLISPMCEKGISGVTVTCQGESLAGAASTIERMALVEVLSDALDVPVNVVNAKLFAEQRGIQTRSVIDDQPRPIAQVVIEIQSGSDRRRIVGAIYQDGQPRVLEICGYHMDMVPAGPMVLLLNEDKPGMIGLIGNEFGGAGANIADMALSRRGDTAMTVLKLDNVPAEALLTRLKSKPGIRKIAVVELPPVKGVSHE